MKALRISRLCVVVAMVFGLFAAWSAAVPQQLSTSQELGTSDEALTGGCGNPYCTTNNPYDCSHLAYGGDPSCTGWYRPSCNWEGPGEKEYSCEPLQYNCDGPSPCSYLPTVYCVEQ